jgi:peptidoglycan/LPS O-acetylase OafA/YrhL
MPDGPALTADDEAVVASAPAMPSGEIKALTSLRGVAAMMVVMQHFSATAEKHSIATIPSLVPHGYVAVDLFFVLSGFIMAYNYLPGFQARGLRAFPDFVFKRGARIVPLNTAAVLLILTAGTISETYLSRDIFNTGDRPFFDGLCNLLMLQGLGLGMNLNAPSWSISTEFAAYLFFPALLALVCGRRVAVAGLAVAVCFASLVVIAFNHARLGLDTATIAGGIVRCFAEFTIGLATYRAITHLRFRSIVSPDGIAATAIGGFLVLLLLRFDLLTLLVIPLLIAALACNSGLVAALFAARVPYFLGVISFSIYMLHSPLRPIYLELLRAFHPAPLPAATAMAAALVGSLLVVPFAWIGFVMVEKPGRRAIRSLSSRLMGRSAYPG